MIEASAVSNISIEFISTEGSIDQLKKFLTGLLHRNIIHIIIDPASRSFEING
jgi:hypothetical protein